MEQITNIEFRFKIEEMRAFLLFETSAWRRVYMIKYTNI